MAAREAKSFFGAIAAKKVVKISKSQQIARDVKENGWLCLTRGQERKRKDGSLGHALQLEALYLATNFIEEPTDVDRGPGKAQDPLLALGQDAQRDN